MSMDLRLGVVPVPVSGVDLAKRFYGERAGFVVDLDMPPGVLEGLQLVVEDIVAARAELLERGVEISDLLQHFDGSDWKPGGAGGLNSFAFSSDPDGNCWVLQERPARN